MFHVGGHKGSRGRATAFSKTYHGILKNTDWKPPLRCGIQFCTLSCILFVVGIVLTCLGIHDVFGETVPITGPILLTVGVLFLVLASRQFVLAHKRKKLLAENKELAAQESKKLAAENGEDGTGASTLLMDGIREDGVSDCGDHQLEPTYHVKKGQHPGLKRPDLEQGTFIWPTLPYQPSPFTCVSMMLGKHPAALCGPLMLSGYSPGTTSTSLSSTRLESSLSPSSPVPGSDHTQAQALTPQPVLSAATSDGSMEGSKPPVTVDVVDAVDAVDAVDVVAIGGPAGAAAPSLEPPNPSSPSNLCSKRPEPSKIAGLPAMVAKDGINSLPSRTAIMMLRTLEIQETI